MTRIQGTVTRLLGELADGSHTAADKLFTLLYAELRAVAHRHRRRWHGDETLNTTALVHEAYLKLVGGRPARAEGRAHFLALAAQAMRHILCNHARGRRAAKRGGGMEVLALDQLKAPVGALVVTPDPPEVLVALDDALRRLASLDRRLSEVVECRFFGGLSVEETAAALGVSSRTVQRDWALAQAWLHREMTSVEP